MNDNNVAISEFSLDLWAEEPVGNVAADCCSGTASTLSTPVLSAGTASSNCP